MSSHFRINNSKSSAPKNAVYNSLLMKQGNTSTPPHPPPPPPPPSTESTETPSVSNSESKPVRFRLVRDPLTNKFKFVKNEDASSIVDNTFTEGVPPPSEEAPAPAPLPVSVSSPPVISTASLVAPSADPRKKNTPYSPIFPTLAPYQDKVRSVVSGRVVVNTNSPFNNPNHVPRTSSFANQLDVKMSPPSAPTPTLSNKHRNLTFSPMLRLHYSEPALTLQNPEPIPPLPYFTSNACNLNYGPTGPTGPTGAVGPTGPQGIPGTSTFYDQSNVVGMGGLFPPVVGASAKESLITEEGDILVGVDPSTFYYYQNIVPLTTLLNPDPLQSVTIADVAPLPVDGISYITIVQTNFSIQQLNNLFSANGITITVEVCLFRFTGGVVSLTETLISLSTTPSSTEITSSVDTNEYTIEPTTIPTYIGTRVSVAGCTEVNYNTDNPGVINTTATIQLQKSSTATGTFTSSSYSYQPLPFSSEEDTSSTTANTSSFVDLKTLLHYLEE